MLFRSRTAMTLRARLMENLLEAGSDTELRRELYLCGLFSQLDLLLGEPLAVALHRLPIAERIHSAGVTGRGAYLPYLAVARAIESGDSGLVSRRCHQHGMKRGHANRALLRTLGQMHGATIKL